MSSIDTHTLSQLECCVGIDLSGLFDPKRIHTRKTSLSEK